MSNPSRVASEMQEYERAAREILMPGQFWQEEATPVDIRIEQLSRILARHFPAPAQPTPSDNEIPPCQK